MARKGIAFEQSARYDARQKAALRLAEAITWGSDLDDAAWEGLYEHCSDAQLTELGFFIGLGQQRFNRLLGLEHQAVLAGMSAGLAP